MKRYSFIATLAATSFLAGCKDPQGTDVKPSTGVIRGGQDIVVKEIRTYTPTDSVAGTNDLYYVVRFVWTNTLGFALKPRLDHFVIEDLGKVRYLGIVSGSSVLIGISNYDGILEKGDSHEYTVGFRVPINTQGQLFYDATF